MRFFRRSFATGLVAGAILFFLLEVVSIAVAALIYQKYWASPEVIAERLVSPPVPSTIEADFNLNLKTLEGEPFALSDLRGEVIFLTFWYPGCSSCQAELPTIESLYEKTSTDAIAFVLAALKGSEEEAAEVVAQYNLTVPVYVMQDERPPVYASHRVPTSYIITRDGKVAFKHQGAAKWDDDTTADFLRSLASSAS